MSSPDTDIDDLSQEEIDRLSDEELRELIDIELSDREKALEHHSDRSRQARVADESFRARTVTEDYETWQSQPGRYDFAGVDTIPPARKYARAEAALQTAQEIGLVEEFVEANSTKQLPGESTQTRGTRGIYQGGQRAVGVRSDLDEEQKAETLAHEVGHAVDYGKWNSAASSMQGLGLGELTPQIASERMLGEIGGPIDDPDETAEELRDRSEQRRGPISPGNREYRDSPEELFADFMGDAIIKPRNTKAEMNRTRESLANELQDPIPELEPTREFVDRELPNSFLPQS